MSNGQNGILVSGGAFNSIGGTTGGAGNVISGNHESGLVLSLNTSQNLVQGNDLGTDVTGKTPLGNSANGIELSTGAASNTIGGTTAGTGNLISANGQDGVRISGASGNTFQGNFIGTDVTGKGQLGNGQNGVEISLGFLNAIGGSTTGAGNKIKFNGGSQHQIHRRILRKPFGRSFRIWARRIFFAFHYRVHRQQRNRTVHHELFRGSRG